MHSTEIVMGLEEQYAGKYANDAFCHFIIELEWMGISDRSYPFRSPFISSSLNPRSQRAVMISITRLAHRRSHYLLYRIHPPIQFQRIHMQHLNSIWRELSCVVFQFVLHLIITTAEN